MSEDEMIVDDNLTEDLPGVPYKKIMQMNDREKSINREIESGKWSYIMIPIKDVRQFIGHAEISPIGCDEILIKPDAKLAFIESEEADND